MGAISGLSTPTGGISIPSTKRIQIAAANSEEAYAFPLNTKQFRVYNDSNYKLHLSYALGETNTDYYIVNAGDEYLVTGISAPNVTIYLQSQSQIYICFEIWR